MNILSLSVNAEEELLIKTLACGIVINLRSVIAPKTSESNFSEIHSAVLPVLSSALNYDLQKASAEAAVAAEVVVSNKYVLSASKDLDRVTDVLTFRYYRTHKSKTLTCPNLTSLPLTKSALWP